MNKVIGIIVIVLFWLAIFIWASWDTPTEGNYHDDQYPTDSCTTVSGQSYPC